MADIHISGLRELNQFLETLPGKVQANVARGSLQAGAKPIQAAAKSLCPVGPPSSSGAKKYGLREGSLRDSIRISSRIKGSMVVATVRAGGRSKRAGDVFFAHWVEFGTKAHPIPKRGVIGTILEIGGRFFRSVEHPGARPKPFMRPALDSQASNAVIVAAQYMRQRLATKHGLDTADIAIEGDE